MTKKINKITIIKIVGILMLLAALGRHPYSYYQILRWVTCGLTGYLAYLSYENKKVAWAWVFGIVAILFNPITPIYFSRETWALLNIIASIIIFVSIFKLKIPQYGEK